MPDTKQLLRETRDRIARPLDVLEGLERRRRHQENVKRVAAAAVAIVIALLGFGGWFLLDRDAAPKPADRSELGIFAPVAGRIVYENEAEVGDLGYDRALWAIDPSGPSDTTAGQSVSEDVASTLVRLPEDGTPLGWSSDGTELLLMRTDGDSLFPQQYLYILHADGSETRLNRDPMYFGGATISPDGTRVVFAAQGDHLGLFVVDAEGGRPVQLPIPGVDGIVMSPTFSPDGTQIAYLDTGNHENHVWVTDADGSNAHEILPNEPTLGGGVGDLQWSPAGDRLALGSGGRRGADALAIYTFAPDGSELTRVIVGGVSPSWSPDGSQIAYTILCEDQSSASCPEGSILRSQYDAHPELFGGGAAGLAIADADGSNVREFGYAASGPWHPGEPVQPDETTPTLDDGFARADGEVLSFTGSPTFTGEPDDAGDLVAVNPETGEQRVLVQDLASVYSASWSADGRWVAYVTPAPEGSGAPVELWVVGGSQEPRLMAAGADPALFADGSVGWVWSRTGAELLTASRSSLDDDGQTIERSKLTVTDLATGETTDLASIEGDAGLEPAWSPDGTRIALTSVDGGVFSVDVRSGDRTLLARLPNVDPDSVDEIQWSPDGTHIAVMNSRADGEARLHVMDADGSDVRVLADNYHPLGIAWSPDGTQLAFAKGVPVDGTVEIWVASMDGGDPADIGFVPFTGCTYNYMCGVSWSPDGSAVGFHKDEAEDSVIAADGSGKVELIDDLTYRSWAGGSYREP